MKVFVLSLTAVLLLAGSVQSQESQDEVRVVAFDRFAKLEGEEQKVQIGTIKNDKFVVVDSRSVDTSKYLYFKTTFDQKRENAVYNISASDFEVYDFENMISLENVINEDVKKTLIERRSKGVMRFCWGDEGNALLVFHWKHGNIMAVEIWEKAMASMNYVKLVDFASEKAAKVDFLGWETGRKQPLFGVIMKMHNTSSDIGFGEWVIEDSKVVGIDIQKGSCETIKKYEKYPFRGTHRDKTEMATYRFRGAVGEELDLAHLEIVHKAIKMGKFNKKYGVQSNDGDDVTIRVRKGKKKKQ